MKTDTTTDMAKKPKHTTEHIDYKDVEALKEFLNPHARIIGKRRSGAQASFQRKVALSVKRARYMALLPYVAR